MDVGIKRGWLTTTISILSSTTLLHLIRFYIYIFFYFQMQHGFMWFHLILLSHSSIYLHVLIQFCIIDFCDIDLWYFIEKKPTKAARIALLIVQNMYILYGSPYAFSYICIHTCIHTYVHTCTYAFMHVFMYLCVCVCVCNIGW